MAVIIELGEKEYNELLNRQLQYQRDRKPAPLCTNATMDAQQIKQQIENHPEFPTWTPEQADLLAIGIAEELGKYRSKTTRLTPYLELDTWTLEQAAYLVSGIDPGSFEINPIRDMLLSGWAMAGVTIATNAVNLAGLPIDRNNSTAFEDAHRVKEIWNSRENPPAKVSPIDFVKWCESKRIDTGWITNADEWAEYAAAQLLESQAANEPESGDKDRRVMADNLITQLFPKYHPTYGLVVCYYGVGEWFDVVKKSKDPSKTDVTRGGVTPWRRHILRLNEQDSIMLEKMGKVMVDTLYPIDFNLEARGTYMFALPQPKLFTKDDIVPDIAPSEHKKLCDKYYDGQLLTPTINKSPKKLELNESGTETRIAPHQDIKYFSGELIAYELASQLCKLNDWPLDSDNHTIAEIHYRENIERGLDAGKITPFSPVTCTKLNIDKRGFESALFSMQEVMDYLACETAGNEQQAEAAADAGASSQVSKEGQQRPGKNGERDLDAASWYTIKKPEEVEKMTVNQIHAELKARDTHRENKLWKRGFADWNRTQVVYPKKKPGRKSGK